MAELSSYIRIDRNILKWRHFKDGKCLHVFLWLLLNVNVKPYRGRDQYFNRGEIVTTHEKIAEEIGASTKSVQRAIEDLEKSGEILIFRQKYGSKIVVKNYRKYQNAKAYKEEEADENEVNDEKSRLDKNDHFSGAEWTKTSIETGQNCRSRLDKNDQSIYIPTNVVIYTNKERGTKKEDQKRTHTRDDIPFSFRDRFATYEDYEKWRNQ